MTPSPASVLIVRLGALGDIVHAMPVVAALRSAYPSARIGWAVQSRFAPLVRVVEGVDHVHPFSRGFDPAVIAQIRRERYEWCVDLQGLIKSAAVARLSGARRIVGFSRALLREPAAALAYSETGGIDDGHVIDKNLSLLARVGIATRERRFPLRVPESAVVPSTRSILGLHDGGDFALINPGAAWPNKRWPADRFGALAVALRERFGLPSAVVWGPDEASLAASVARASGGAAHMAPQTTMVEMLALARASRLLVSGDTGPLHLAAAVATPVVGIYGPTPAQRNGPWSAEDRVVSAHAACGCAFKRLCTAETWCLAQVSVEAVVAAVAHRLEAA